MGHREETAHIEAVDGRFDLRDWLGAILGISAVLAGAILTLALVYWTVTAR